MRLDGDYYELTMDGLVNLYDKLSVGGYAIIDDYGEDTWTYCRKAVDEFRQARGIADPLIRVDFQVLLLAAHALTTRRYRTRRRARRTRRSADG